MSDNAVSMKEVMLCHVGTRSIEQWKVAKKGTGHQDSDHLWWMDRKTPRHVNHSRKAPEQREQSAVCP